MDLSNLKQLGNVESVRQSMDKEDLLTFLILFLFIGGNAMGYIAGAH